MIKIISGAQTGVDCAVLDIAIKFKIPYTGYIPLDGNDKLSAQQLIKQYPKLLCTNSPIHNVRTALNVLNGDIFINIVPTGYISEGTDFGIDFLKALQKPYINITNLSYLDIEKCKKWLSKNTQIKKETILGVGGPSEIQFPEIYNKSYKFFDAILKKYRNNF